MRAGVGPATILLLVCGLAAPARAADTVAADERRAETTPTAARDGKQEPDEETPRESRQGSLLGPEAGETLGEWTARWMEGPVRTIASREEIELYEALETTQERLRFIRLFWESRDPRIRGPVNEFREEFEARVAYANENFGDEERPGWKTPFGQLALLLGPPDDTFRMIHGVTREYSEHPPIVWTYDRKIPEWPVNENFVFVRRLRRWRLLPHSLLGEADDVARQWEASSTLEVTPTDFYRVQEAIVEETRLHPVDYRRAVEAVQAEVAFPEAEIPFGWEPSFRAGTAGNTAVDLELSLRMESLIFHSVDGDFETDMIAIATLLDGEGEPVAQTSQPFTVTVPAPELEVRSGEIVTRTLNLSAPPGTYVLRLVLEDRLLGYRTSYRVELEVPSR